MNRSWLYLFLIMTSAITFVSCNDDNDTDLVGNWTTRTTVEFEDDRTSAFSFCIGDTFYIGTGYLCNGSELLKTCYKYSLATGTWDKIADFPGAARKGAIGFSVKGRGYAGTGVDDNLNYFDDFYEYNPQTNVWTKKQSLIVNGESYARTDAVAFSFKDGNCGYVGTGSTDIGDLSNFFKFTPGATDADPGTWEKVANCNKSYTGATCFVIDSKAYLVSGYYNGSPSRYFYSFDANTEKWTDLADIINSNDEESFDDDYTTLTGIDASSFVSPQGKGYLINGKYVWEYTPATDRWIQKTSFEGTYRTNAVAFTISGRMFFGTGNSSSSCMSDIWEFRPDEEFEEYD